MIESLLLEDLAHAFMADRQEEAHHCRAGDRPGPLTALIARLLVRIGLRLDPAIGQDLAWQPAASGAWSMPLPR